MLIRPAHVGVMGPSVPWAPSARALIPAGEGGFEFPDYETNNLFSPNFNYLGNFGEGGRWNGNAGLSAWSHGQADPLSGTEATLIAEASGTTLKHGFVEVGFSISAPYTGTFSFYAKRHASGSARNVYTGSITGSDFAGILVDLGDGSIVDTLEGGNGSLVETLVTPVDETGWFFIQIAFLHTSGTTLGFEHYLADPAEVTVNDALDYNGDGSSGVLFWRDRHAAGNEI